MFEELINPSVSTTFERAKFYLESNNWYLYFTNHTTVEVGSFWRVLKDDKILVTSTDHGQKFGLPHHINVEEELLKYLIGVKMLKILRNTKTGDLRIELSGGWLIEVFTTSCGYENWQVTTEKNQFIGLGAGEIAVFPVLKK